MEIRVVFRGWQGDRLVFEEPHSFAPGPGIEVRLVKLAAKHGALLLSGDEMFQVEIEFLDEPNQNERFLRFGTDPRRMVAPIGVVL